VTTTPDFWILMMTRLLGTGEGFAHKLWRHYPASQALRWQLQLCQHVPANTEAWASRVKHLSELMSPVWLLQTSLRMAPERGQNRPKEHVAFEQKLLQLLDRNGHWRW
jgi:hypothetical protein